MGATKESRMKKYLIFGGDQYYPRGGWSDFIKDFETLESALDYIARLDSSVDWIHIVNTSSGRVEWER